MRAEFCCMACEGREAFPLHEAVPDYFLPTGIRVDYVRCARCDLVQQHPLPSDVAPFYAGYPVHSTKSVLHEITRRAVLRPVYFPLDALRPWQVLLDYGCGDGWFLDQVRHRVSYAVGYEPNPAHAAHVSQRIGLPVYHNARSLATALSGTVDVITMHFVLEHVVDVAGTLRLLTDLLKPGGILRAVVPNLENVEYRWFGPRWHGFDAPRHISFPAPDHLKPILSACGLTMLRDEFVPFPNTLAASLSIALTGRYRTLPFLAFLAPAIIWARLYPRGTRAMTLQKL